jgi:hypothetical protein
MKLLGSTSDYFRAKPELKEDREFMIDILSFWSYNDLQISYFTTAFDYFCNYPEQYDGATASQDLEDIPGLEFAAMLHDFNYVVFNAKMSIEAMRIADMVMKSNMRKMQKSGVEITWRMFRLDIIRRPYALLNQIKSNFKKRADIISTYEFYIAFAKA